MNADRAFDRLFVLLVALLVTLALSLASAPTARAGAAPPETPEGILSFADSLVRQGESYRAVTEYMRVLHHFSSDSAYVLAANEGLVEAYARAGRWQDVAFTLEKILLDHPEAKYRRALGEAYYRAGRNGEAADAMLGAKDAADGERVLGTLAYLKLGLGEEHEAPPTADGEAVREFRELDRKSPLLAGTLSALLPGSGHLYVDRPHDAAVAFVLNAAFIWGTVEAIRDENWGLAGVLGAAELFWYSGTIVGSVNGAEKWNRREEERFYDRWEARAEPRWSLWTDGSTGGGVLLGLSW